MPCNFKHHLDLVSINFCHQENSLCQQYIAARCRNKAHNYAVDADCPKSSNFFEAFWLKSN